MTESDSPTTETTEATTQATPSSTPSLQQVPKGKPWFKRPSTRWFAILVLGLTLFGMFQWQKMQTTWAAERSALRYNEALAGSFTGVMLKSGNDALTRNDLKYIVDRGRFESIALVSVGGQVRYSYNLPTEQKKFDFNQDKSSIRSLGQQQYEVVSPIEFSDNKLGYLRVVTRID